MNYAGDSNDAYSVIMDSALGLLGAAPGQQGGVRRAGEWLQGYLSELLPPKYPFPIDTARAGAGKTLFNANCAACHASEKTGTAAPLADVGTDRGRLDSWNKGAAIKANQVVKEMGLERKGLVEEDLIGYVAPFLDGIWLKAPYLHNGSVPTLRDLLEPVTKRPKVFWRGYDVYDQAKGRLRHRWPGSAAHRHPARHHQQGWEQPGARVRAGQLTPIGGR
jgi:hypothetical protein